jgi:hypothetical protein
VQLVKEKEQDRHLAEGQKARNVGLIVHVEHRCLLIKRDIGLATVYYEGSTGHVRVEFAGTDVHPRHQVQSLSLPVEIVLLCQSGPDHRLFRLPFEFEVSRHLGLELTKLASFIPLVLHRYSFIWR